ncbi:MULTISPECIES: hypothetical protein [Anaerolinea]|uniref:hypothetical protein n=1 Tax=Anaerolinea TaxID=233189 RepID=UPI0026191058|nr:hypothetical protein [Anaerolinea thermophila]
MNKHPWAIFFIVAFTISAWFGFLFAIRVEQLGLLNFSSPSAVHISNSQVNYLVIEVDSLSSSKPSFQSAWMVLRYQSSNQSALHLMRIDTSEDLHKDLQSNFQIKQDKLAQKFTRQLSKKGYQWAYFVVVDQKGLEEIKSAFPKEISDSTGKDLKGILSATCQVLGNRPILSYPLNVDALKEHVSTNWSKDLAIKEWERLTASPKPTRCEWYPTH